MQEEKNDDIDPLDQDPKEIILSPEDEEDPELKEIMKKIEENKKKTALHKRENSGDVEKRVLEEIDRLHPVEKRKYHNLYQ